MTIHIAKTEHEVAYQDLVKLLSKHASTLTPLEMLAVAANLVGKVIAMQDQSKTTKETALKVVIANIEMGNQHVIENLKVQVGGNA